MLVHRSLQMSNLYRSSSSKCSWLDFAVEYVYACFAIQMSETCPQWESTWSSDSLPFSFLNYVYRTKTGSIFALCTLKFVRSSLASMVAHHSNRWSSRAWPTCNFGSKGIQSSMTGLLFRSPSRSRTTYERRCQDVTLLVSSCWCIVATSLGLCSPCYKLVSDRNTWITNKIV